jgi:hypothetical protein
MLLVIGNVSFNEMNWWKNFLADSLSEASCDSNVGDLHMEAKGNKKPSSSSKQNIEEGTRV